MLFNGYPRCSTSRKAEKWLQENNVSYDFRDIVKDNPTAEEIEKWHKLSGLDIKRFFNTSGLKYRELQLKDKLKDMSDEEKYQLLATDGMLVKRPLVIDGSKVLIGFREKEWEEHFLK